MHYGICANRLFRPWRSIWSAGWNVPILGLELKRHTESFTNVQFPSNFLSMLSKLCFWWKCKFLLIIWLEVLIYRVSEINNCYLEHFASIFVHVQNGSECVVEKSWCHFGIQCANHIKLSQIFWLTLYHAGVHVFCLQMQTHGNLCCLLQKIQWCNQLMEPSRSFSAFFF